MARASLDVVCDAGPLIHLDELGCLDLLADFHSVLVPEQVWQEVEVHRPGALGPSSLRACDRKSQCVRLGELHHGLEEGFVSTEDDIVELGELALGQRLGRACHEQITVCDLTGVAVQDTATALRGYRKARESGFQREIEI